MDDRQRFTTGDCHILALALYEASDDKVDLAVIEAEDFESHAFIIRGNYALDIEGKTTLKKLLKKWDAKSHKIVSADHFDENKGNWGLAETYLGSWERAEELAPDLIKELND